MCYYSQTDLKYVHFFLLHIYCQMIGCTNSDSQRLVHTVRDICPLILQSPVPYAFGYKCYISAPGVKSHKISITRKLM